MAMPTTDILIQTLEQFTIEASPAGTVQFMEGNGNAWRASMTIGSRAGSEVIDFSVKYINSGDNRKVTITIKAMNSSGKVVVSDNWSGKLSEEKENFSRWNLLDF